MQISVTREQDDGKYEKRQGCLRAMPRLLRTLKRVRKLLQGFAAGVGFEMQVH
jgi:hypothetical protein